METTNIVFRKGNKVILRPVLESDIPQFHIWMNDPDVTEYLLTFMPMSLKEEYDWFEKISKPTNNSLVLAIVDASTDKLIGSIGINNVSMRDGTATTGTSIGDKKYWSKGYGTEAKMLLLEFAFHEMNLRKICSEVTEYNERSLAYARKCGYKEEARLPKQYYRKGKYWDKVILAVYRTKWEKIWKKFSKTLNP